MRIANIAAIILATASFLAFAQRSGGRVERKPSPSTSAVSTSAAPSGAQAASGLQPATNLYRPNSGSSAPVTAQQNVSRPAPAPAALPIPIVPAQTVAPQLAPTSIAASVPVSVPQPGVPAPSSEPMAAVNYSQGQLTVVSQSASLGTVLKLISAKTGAVIDLAPELQNEPVIAQIGPSAVREVMTALLDSPKIDYIIMGAGNASGRHGTYPGPHASDIWPECDPHKSPSAARSGGADRIQVCNWRSSRRRGKAANAVDARTNDGELAESSRREKTGGNRAATAGP